MKPKNRRAFTLIEVLTVAFIATLVVGLLLPPALSSYILRQRIAKEEAILAQLKATIETSFETRDLDTFNVSALPGEIDSASHATGFSTSTTPGYPTIDGYEWFSRVARARGFSVAPGQAVTKSSQPAIYDLAFNDVDRPRLLLVGPTETNQQRYLLISCLGRDDELILPAFQNTAAFFNDIWNTPWDRFDATLPASWNSALTAAQVANWSSDTPGKTRLHRLRVVRITQRRFEVVVNSNHPTDSVWVRWNNDNAQFTLAPNTGNWSSLNTPTATILAGRILSIYTGDIFANAKKTEITVRERTVFTSQ